MKDKLADTEAKAARLLAEIQETDRQLSSMSPAEPGRPALIAKKAEILPRYRGAKALVKDLRRALNSTVPAIHAEPSSMGYFWPVTPAVMRELYTTLVSLVDRHHGDAGKMFSPEEAEAIDAFLEVMDDPMADMEIDDADSTRTPR